MFDSRRSGSKRRGRARRATGRRAIAPRPPIPLVILEQPRVVLLQEEKASRGELVEALSRKGFEPVVAPDAPTLLDLAETAPAFEMAVVDMDWPAEAGTEIVRALRESDPGLFVAMLSGSASQEELAEGYRAGASAALRPDASPDEIADVLKAQLPRAGVRRRRTEERSEPPRSFGSRVRAWLPRRRVRRAAGLFAASLLLGVGLASLLDWIFGLSDRGGRASNPLIELLRQGAGERRMDRQLLLEHLRLAQEANDLTRRYYDAQIEQPIRQPLPAPPR